MARARANLAAVVCLRSLQAQGRAAAAADQAILARWSGWGAVPAMFDSTATRFEKLRRQLLELLSPDELAAAARNTLNAHYTDADVVAEIWSAMGALGFEAGRVLEPGCGAGSFIGLAPPGASMVGVELDPTTAAIAQALYPDAQVLAESFADTRVPEASFDATVGNVPFGKVVLVDTVHNPAGHSIHNHFILKALRLTRPGGLVGLLSSRYTLDARNPAARREMAELADLLGALRLPEGAHRRAAGTDVVTDLLILRRRVPGEPGQGAQFERSVPIELNGVTVALSEYFVEHPGHVLGELHLARGMFSTEELSVRGDHNVVPALRQGLGEITSAARAAGALMTPAPAGVAVPAPLALLARSAGRPDGYIQATDEGFTQVVGGQELSYRPARTQVVELRALLGLRDTMVALLEAEAATREDTAQIAGLRNQLNEAYDTYVARYGPINRCTWRNTGRIDPDTGEASHARIRPRRGGFGADPFAAALDALECYDPEDGRANKAGIFAHRVIAPPPARLGADRPEDALAICLDNHGEVRLDEVARLLGSSPAVARTQLARLVFEDPDDARLVPAAQYCSGNVRAKLARARAAAEEDTRFGVNVEALMAVLPAELGPSEIEARLGAAWISQAYVQAFLCETLEADDVVVEHPGGCEWSVRGGRRGVLATQRWGTERRPAGELAESLLRQRAIRVDDTLDDGKRVPNLTETAAALERAAELSERFSEWVWEDPQRANELASAYNERFNNLVLRSYDDVRPALPGLALSFEPRTHQLGAVARIVAEPAVLLAHEVGAGKTAAMAMGAMELRRLGLVSKPAMVVPNHMVDQFAREFHQLYPQAKVLIADKAALGAAKSRRHFAGRCATGEWDAIVMAHSAFELIPLSGEHQRSYLTAERDRVASWLGRARQERSLSVKNLERKLLNAEESLKKRLAAGKADSGVSFEQTGIDYLFVDEAHLFKNLHTASNIADANINGSQRAQDMDMKLDWLRSRNAGGRCATFATATPVANSVTEAYVVQRYLRPDLLSAAGIEDFDTWAATFAETVAGVELSPDGASFRMKARFAKFTNVPELLRMLHVAADVKTAADLGLPTPKLAGGAAETVVIPGSDELKALVAELGSRADAVRSRAVRPEEDNMLKISSDGRAAALDLRLQGAQRPEGPTKLDVAADHIASIWRAHRDDRFIDPAGVNHPRPGALQLVFADLGTPSERWNVYDQLRFDLVARGMPRESIRFVHEAANDRAKAELFAACRAGSVAVLIGSTVRMGVGVNVQARAIALHHLDCPWRPADLAQRDGRIIRQGNQHPEVRVLRYVTEGSFDTYCWQTVERKARFISQLMRGRLDMREIDDIGDTTLSYAEVKALAAGNPRLIEQAQLDAEAVHLERLERAWGRAQVALAQRQDELSRACEVRGAELAAVVAARARHTPTSGDRFAMQVGGVLYERRPDAGLALMRRLVAESALARGTEVRTVGNLAHLGGFELAARVWHNLDTRAASLELVGVARSQFNLSGAEIEPTPGAGAGLVARLERRLANLDHLPDVIAAEVTAMEAERARAAATRSDRFPQAEALRSARTRSAELAAELAALVVKPGEEVPPITPDKDRMRAARSALPAQAPPPPHRHGPQIYALRRPALRPRGPRP